MAVMRIFVWLLAVASAGCAGGLRLWVVSPGSFTGPGVTLGPVGGGGLGLSLR